MGDEIGLIQILLLTLLPAFGSALGMALAEWRKPPAWLTGTALHMAAGIGTAVAAIELLPRAQERAEIWLVALTFVIGALASVALAGISRRLRNTESRRKELVWGAYTTISIDLFSDGLMTGGGGAVAANLGVLLAASQVLGNIPGGFAITAGFREGGVERRKRLLAALSYPLAPMFGGLIGFLVLDGAGDLLTGAVLALFAGMLLTATIEDLVPEADQPGARRRLSSPGFAFGFVLLLLMSTYFGV